MFVTTTSVGLRKYPNANGVLDAVLSRDLIAQDECICIRMESFAVVQDRKYDFHIIKEYLCPKV